jgi:AcrR family transcriptional regulator
MPKKTNTKQIPEKEPRSVAPEATASVELGGLEPIDEWNALLEEISHRPKRVTERKQDRSKRTEQQILNGALRVFARDGISRARIADIAAEAGISTSTLYEYYKSKEDLAYDVPMSRFAEFYDAYHSAVEAKNSTRERLLLYLTMSADYAREHVEWGRLLYLEIWPSVLVSETEMRHSINDFVRVIVYLIKCGMQEGWIRKDRSTYETSAMLVGGLNQTIITWLLYRQPLNLTKAGADLAERMIAMLELEASQPG